jgi:glutamine amidotransferase PdxT
LTGLAKDREGITGSGGESTTLARLISMEGIVIPALRKNAALIVTD